MLYKKLDRSLDENVYLLHLVKQYNIDVEELNLQFNSDPKYPEYTYTELIINYIASFIFGDNVSAYIISNMNYNNIIKCNYDFTELINDLDSDKVKYNNIDLIVGYTIFTSILTKLERLSNISKYTEKLILKYKINKIKIYNSYLHNNINMYLYIIRTISNRLKLNHKIKFNYKITNDLNTSDLNINEVTEIISNYNKHLPWIKY